MQIAIIKAKGQVIPSIRFFRGKGNVLGSSQSSMFTASVLKERSNKDGIGLSEI
jgi:hypothetical protein